MTVSAVRNRRGPRAFGGYEAWAFGVADDRRLLDLIDELPEAKRQPNLVFAAARFAGIGPGPFADFRADLAARWPELRAIALAKRTQTNEPGRCAVLRPLLTSLSQPIAVLEVGASTGLCLYPDNSARPGQRVCRGRASRRPRH